MTAAAHLPASRRGGGALELSSCTCCFFPAGHRDPTAPHHASCWGAPHVMGSAPLPAPHVQRLQMPPCPPPPCTQTRACRGGCMHSFNWQDWQAVRVVAGRLCCGALATGAQLAHIRFAVGQATSGGASACFMPGTGSRSAAPVAARGLRLRQHTLQGVATATALRQPLLPRCHLAAGGEASAWQSPDDEPPCFHRLLPPSPDIYTFQIFSV